MKQFKNLFALLLISFLFTNAIAQPGKLISYKKVYSYSISDLDSLWKTKKIKKFIADIKNPLDVFEVIYETTWHDGSAVQASGIFFLPRKENKEFPMICYHHGTQIYKDRKIGFESEQAICTAYSAGGYMVAYPDYVGIGKGEKKHLYLHVETEAAAAINLMRAVKEILVKENAKQNNYLFLTGYSQGGHATLASLKIIQERYASEFKVTASAPMSGAYDLNGEQSKVMFKPYTHPGYLPYLLYSYQEVYKCFNDNEWPFVASYSKTLPQLFDGNHKFSEINKAMPAIPKDILSDEFLKALSTNDTFSFKLKLEENSVDNWKPETPVFFCYCKGDEQVPYQNAINASKTMKKNGAKNIKLHKSSNKMRHNPCAIFSSMYTKMYFDSIVNGKKNWKKGNLSKRILISIAKIKARK